MKLRSTQRTVLIFFLAILSTPSLAISPGEIPADKTLVIDGHVVHNRGNLWNHVTNFGLIGSTPSTALPFSHAPSARWPGEFGADQLWAAGLWVGATVAGEHLVTTGAYGYEMRPTEAAEDTIYATARGEIGGSRFPFALPDDDGDGLEDEDPLNGIDDDLDGLVDEDFAAIGDQHFRCTYADTAGLLQTIFPDHKPLGIMVTQQSFQWDGPVTGDLIGYDFTITNIGPDILEQVYLGMFADFDIGSGPGSSANDKAGSWQGQVVVAGGETVPVSVAFVHDPSGYAGFVLCGYSGIQPCGSGSGPQISSLQFFSGNAPFENGGDPTNDSERYATMSDPGTDPDQGIPGDYRLLMSSGPFADLEPGASLEYQVALVAGPDLQGLTHAASEAVKTFYGRCFDRDNNPANGDEFHVRWLRPEDTPVASGTGHLDATAGGGVAEIAISIDQGLSGALALSRPTENGLQGRQWFQEQWISAGMDQGSHHYAVLDEDRGSWPRTYHLVLGRDQGLQKILDSVTIDAVPGAGTTLRVGPNPFNPALIIDFVLDRPGPSTLDVFDLKGRRVKRLLAETLPTGPGQVTWRGMDDSGRDVPGGIYFVQLSSPGKTRTTRATLVR